MKLINKAAVVAEIERRKHELLDHIICESDKEWVVRTAHQLNRILLFLDSLEVKEYNFKDAKSVFEGQYLSKDKVVTTIERLQDECEEQSDNNGVELLEKLFNKLDTLEVKEVDVSNISENLAEAYEYLDYTSTGNLAYNKPMVGARLKRVIKSLFDAGLFELTHDKKYRMEKLGLKAQKGGK